MEKYDIHIPIAEYNHEVFKDSDGRIEDHDSNETAMPLIPVIFEDYEYIGTLDQEVDEVLNA